MKALDKSKTTHIAEVVSQESVGLHLHGLHKKKFLRLGSGELTDLNVVTQVVFSGGVLQVTTETIGFPLAGSLTEEHALVDVLYTTDPDIIE